MDLGEGDVEPHHRLFGEGDSGSMAVVESDYNDNPNEIGMYYPGFNMSEGSGGSMPPPPFGGIGEGGAPFGIMGEGRHPFGGIGEGGPPFGGIGGGGSSSSRHLPMWNLRTEIPLSIDTRSPVAPPANELPQNANDIINDNLLTESTKVSNVTNDFTPDEMSTVSSLTIVTEVTSTGSLPPSSTLENYSLSGHNNTSFEHGATRNTSETNTVSDALLTWDQVIILSTVIPAVVILLITALLLWLFVFRKKRHRNVRVGTEMQENGRGIINANAAPEGDEEATPPSRLSKLSSSTHDTETGVNGDRRQAWNGNGNGAAVDVT